MKVVAAGLGKVNIWRLSSGELCTRPGLRRIYTPGAGRELARGFSQINGLTGELFHYVYDVATTGSKDLRLLILDEDFVVYKAFGFGLNIIPRVVTPIVVQQQMLLTSPDHPTLYSILGSDVILATRQDSVSGSETIDVPRGIGCVWQGRPVICDGPIVYVGDPITGSGGDLRSFIGENANSPGGSVYGVHQGAGGMLLIATDGGVLGLDAAAATVGVVGTANVDWRLLSHHAAFAYESSAVIRGRLFALSADGLILADVEDGAEILLDEAAQSRALYSRIEGGDYRDARLLAGDEGPWVALESEDACWVSDRRSGLASWWRGVVDSGDLRVRGFLRDVDGKQLVLAANGVFRMLGDFDGEVALTSATATQPKGVLFGRLDPEDSDNVLITEIRARGALGGTGAGEFHAAVHGKAHARVAVVDPNGLTIGVTAWGATDRRYTSTPIAAVGITFGQTDAVSGRDPTFEVGIDGCSVVIDDPSVLTSESAVARVARKG